jgi:hypothetical protein
MNNITKANSSNVFIVRESSGVPSNRKEIYLPNVMLPGK